MLNLNTVYNLLYKGVGDYHVLYICDRKVSVDYAKKELLKLLGLCDEYICMTENVSNKIKLLLDGRKIVVGFISQFEVDKQRGEDDLDEINIDNAGWIEDKKISDSIALLAKRSNANVSMASTPNGERNLFYETWHDSIIGTAPFKMSSMKWYLDDRFNKDLKGSSGLQSYNIDNIGMLFEALENRDMITNKWYEERKVVLGSNIVREIDGEFV